MTSMTFGGKPVVAAATTTQAALPSVSPGADVLVVFRLIALNLEARRELVWAIEAAREIDVDALDDPALADHPRRPAMLQLYEDRCHDERLAVLKLAELNGALARAWAALPVETRNRYGLPTIIGADPEDLIDLTLWCDDRGLGLLVPFPEGWAVPHDIAHRALDSSAHDEKSTYSREELLNAPGAPF